MTNPALRFGSAGMHYAATGAMAGACVTDAERALANNACARTVMRGVGQFTTTQQALGWYYDEDTRWRDVDPCVVAQLPSCPCVSQDDVDPMMGCFAGGPPQGWSADETGGRAPIVIAQTPEEAPFLFAPVYVFRLLDSETAEEWVTGEVTSFGFNTILSEGAVQLGT